MVKWQTRSVEGAVPLSRCPSSSLGGGTDFEYGVKAQGGPLALGARFGGFDPHYPDRLRTSRWHQREGTIFVATLVPRGGFLLKRGSMAGVRIALRGRPSFPFGVSTDLS